MNPHRLRPAASRRIKLFGLLIGGHGLLVLLKLLAIAGVIGLLGALQLRFGVQTAAVVLLHLAIIGVAAMAFVRWRRRAQTNSG